MIDRYNALTVVLERDTRDDDAEKLINIIKSIRGVAEVTPNIVDMNSYVEQVRANTLWKEKLINLLNEKE